MTDGFIRTGAELGADVDESCDVCIVGSGAGGAVLAAELAGRGLSVVVLEEGGHFTKADFNGDEATLYPKLYMGRGAWATKDLAVSILQGRTVGGSTTINWTTSYRTPDRILEHWQQHHGIELDTATLTPHWDAVEKRLNIMDWPNELANRNNRVILDGCNKLGWQVHHIRRNVKGCLNSGYCGVGCPVDAKQAMGITFLADAVAAGARVYSNVRVERLQEAGGRVVSVHGIVLDQDSDAPLGRAVTIRPKIAVSSAGAIGGPALLMRSGLDRNGRTGKRTFIHPVIGVASLFDEPVNGFHGAPQSIVSHQFIDRGPDKMGFFVEAPPVQPMLVSTANLVLGELQQQMLRSLPHTALTIALSVDGVVDGDEGGTVEFKPNGLTTLDYPITPVLEESLRASTKAMTELALAAGASVATVQHAQGTVEVRPGGDLGVLDRLPFGALDVPLFTAHVMGGCAMGPDPERAVVRNDLRHHHIENLFVVDGSVFPTSLGVNPSESIYGLARWAAAAVAEAV